MVIASTVTSSEPENVPQKSAPHTTGEISAFEIEAYVKGASAGRSLFILESNGQASVIVALRPVASNVAEALAILDAQKRD